MAVLAIAGASALGSTALGLGWQAGWLIGSTVGSLLFGPDQPDIEGPRLRDLSVTSSAWGAPIPLIYGTMRAPATSWSSPRRATRAMPAFSPNGTASRISCTRMRCGAACSRSR